MGQRNNGVRVKGQSKLTVWSTTIINILCPFTLTLFICRLASCPTRFRSGQLPGNKSVGDNEPVGQYGHDVKRKFDVFADELTELITIQPG